VRGAAAAWTALAAVLAVRVAGKAVDDFYITYRYAWNLAHGHGFVFNPGERIFGLTDPGLGLLLGALHFVTRLPIPILGTVTTAISLVGIALILLLEGIERERRTEALVGGTLLVGSSWMWVNQGAGAFPTLFLLLLGARIADRRPAVAGLLAGAAVWMRPDALAGIALLGLLLWIEKRRLPWRYALVALAMVCAGAGAAWLWFGTALPNTLGAKAAMAAAAPGTSWAGPVRFWERALVFLPRHWGPWWAVIAALGIAGLIPLFARSGRAGRLLVLFGAALAIAYPLLGVPFFLWYTVPTAAAVLYGVPALALGFFLQPPEGAQARSPGREPRDAGVPNVSSPRRGRQQARCRPLRGLGEGEDAISPGLTPRATRSRPLRGLSGHLFGRTAAAVVLLPLLLSLLPATWSWFRGFGWQRQLETYRQAGLWIRDYSKPDEAIAYVEIGVLAYASERPVIDLLGLVTPEAVPYVLAKDLPGAFLARPAPWVVHHTRGRMESVIRRRWFQRAYREAARFEEPGGRQLTVYRIRPDAKLPPARRPR
jgi:hypothetical protein